MRFVLHTFGYHGEVQTLANANHCAGQGLCGRVVLHVMDEALVQFEGAQRNAPQVAQAGITGAEIVHRQLNAQRMQFVQVEHDARVGVEHDAFGNFQGQVMGLQCVLLERVDDLPWQVAVMEVGR